MISKNEIVTLLEIDWVGVTVALIMTLCIVVLIWQKLDYIKEKLHIKTKRDVEHELLVHTSQSLTKLQQQHVKDMEEFRKRQEENVAQSIKHDERIRNDLSDFMSEMREVIDSLTQQMNQYAENRVHDREQSREIQRQMNARSDDRDQKVEALMLGNMELLGDKIDQRFSKYVALNGIPENEVEEFAGIFKAYKALNGNHKREEKYNYVKNHMKVIPVESTLKVDE